MVRVKEYMTVKVDCVSPEDTVKDVISLIKKTSHDAFPVVSNGKLQGIVSVHDLIGKDESEKIKDLMTEREEMIVTKPEANVMDVGRVMFRTGFSKLPVVDDDNNLIGIITNTDVIRSQIEKTTPTKLEKIIKSYKNLGYDVELKKEPIPVSELKPTQSKVYEDELFGRIYELNRGLAEPIIVIETNKTKYIIVDGHHRAVAAHRLKIPNLEAYILSINTDKTLGIEKTAERQGLNSLDDVKVIDEDKNDSYNIYKLKTMIKKI